MMLYPAMNELLEKVPSRYQLVNVVAARARKIATRAEREELMLEDKPVSIAIREIAEGKLEEEEALAEEFGDLEEEDLLPEEDTEEEAPAEDEEE
jgi:DNA-directed RNA polymerase subunit omega